MSGNSNKPSVHRLERPRPVLVDPARVWVLPRPVPRRDRQQSIGMRARSFGTQPPGGGWVPAALYSWVLLYVTGATWYGEVAITLHARNHHQDITVKQWVPSDAIRLPTGEEAQRLQW